MGSFRIVNLSSKIINKQIYIFSHIQRPKYPNGIELKEKLGIISGTL
jgi:hypothetical protein